MIKNKITKLIDKIAPKVIIVNLIDDIDLIIDALRKNQAVIVNTSRLNNIDSNHIVDFLTGYCYALNGNYSKIDTYIYRFQLK